MKSFFPTAILALLCFSLCAPVDAKPRKKSRAKVAAKTGAGAKANLSAPASRAAPAVNFGQWPGVSQFIDEMVAKHQFDPAELQTLMQRTHHIERAVQLIKPAPPGRAKNWQAYRKLVVEPVRMRAGLQFWNQYAEPLARAEHDYGVPAEIIVGILGVETVYGKNTGSFRVLDVVSTLAFDYPESPKRLERMAFFRGELENTLLLARESHIDPLSLQGSYAGAIGLPQFMPGSIRRYAVDHDGDGKIDLLRSPQDAIGSIAYFLQKHGWRRGESAVFEAQVNPAETNNWQRFLNQGLVAKYTLTEMQAAGVNPTQPIPAETLLGLVDLQNGQESTEYYLGTNNFFTLTQYNRSYFYAMSVLELGSAIRQLRGH